VDPAPVEQVGRTVDEGGEERLEGCRDGRYDRVGHLDVQEQLHFEEEPRRQGQDLQLPEPVVDEQQRLR